MPIWNVPMVDVNGKPYGSLAAILGKPMIFMGPSTVSLGGREIGRTQAGYFIPEGLGIVMGYKEVWTPQTPQRII